MAQSSMVERVSAVLQECEAEWKQRLQDAEQRIRELEEENNRLRQQPTEQRSILNEITDPALRNRLEPFLGLKSLPLDTLIREAGVVLEDRLRTTSQAPSRLVGVNLVDKALKPPEPLIVFSTHGGEQEGVQMLYRGAIQFIRNPPMHRPIQYAESTVRLFLHLIDSLLLLLSEREPPPADEKSLENLYSVIKASHSRTLAMEVTKAIEGWEPERIAIKPTKRYISFQVAGRRFAEVAPQMGFFNIYTYDSGGEWSRYRINRRRDVERALPIVRTSFEACLAGRDPRQVQKKSKPKKKAPPTEEEFWSSLQQQAPTEHEAIRQLIDWYRARDDIELDSMRVGLLVRLDIRDTGRQATIFLAQSSGSLGVWPATIRGQLRKAGVDPSPVERYDAEIRRLVKKPTQSKEFYRSIADVNVDEFKTAVDELIKEIQQTN